MNSQISFIDGQFSLIHVPLELYSSVLQPILQLLLPHGSPSFNHEPEGILEGLSPDHKHGFLNVSITPIECSIVCHTSWAQAVFLPIIKSSNNHKNKNAHDAASQVQISKETYTVFNVSSAGMEAGQRVMDLTAPLAMAGIPIFFITTYYSDFILVPSKDQPAVVNTLVERGFEFSECDSVYMASTPSVSSRMPSISINASPVSTPRPSNVAELQVRTFAQLRKRNVVPFVEPDLHLVRCSGKEMMPSYSSYNGHDHGCLHGNGNGDRRSQWLESINPSLYIGLIAALTARPRFLSITLAQDDAPSLLLDKELLPLFGSSIVGDTNGDLVPVFLDLVALPLASTGIVCGVAGKLVEEMRSWNEVDGAELGYLSTARAGAVVLSREGSARALEALAPLLETSE